MQFQSKLETDLRCSIQPLLPPACLLKELPCTPALAEFVEKSRNTVSDIIHGRDDRLLVVIGPCSIHCVDAAIDYAKRLKVLADAYQNELFVVMRVYFEKPRTTVGWKGLINDPHLDGTYDINTGLRVARNLLLEVTKIGLPVASEMLDPISPQYISDLMSWGAIGARTCESQIHRELASCLSFPVGFKNGTSGNMKVAVDSIISARSPHCFMGVSIQGLAAIVETNGNNDCHLILRGGESGPNFSPSHVQSAVAIMNKAGVPASIVVDCSHGNSNKDHNQQLKVVTNICEQIIQHSNSGNDSKRAVTGVMLESFLVAGNQSHRAGMSKQDLVFGQSITDACISWDQTETVIAQLADTIRQSRNGL